MERSKSWVQPSKAGLVGLNPEEYLEGKVESDAD